MFRSSARSRHGNQGKIRKKERERTNGGYFAVGINLALHEIISRRRSSCVPCPFKNARLFSSRSIAPYHHATISFPSSSPPPPSTSSLSGCSLDNRGIVRVYRPSCTSNFVRDARSRSSSAARERDSPADIPRVGYTHGLYHPNPLRKE